MAFLTSEKNILTLTSANIIPDYINKQFGTSSASFVKENSTNIILTAPNTQLNISKDFCIEGWLYCSSVITGGIISILNNTDERLLSMSIVNNLDAMDIRLDAGDIAFYVGGTLENLFPTMKHFAFNRNESTMGLYVDGSRIATTTTNFDISTGKKIIIGHSPDHGYGTFSLDSFRVTNFASVYSGSTLVVPTTEFT